MPAMAIYRWTPLIVRELVLGNTRFNDIARGLPGLSRTLLTQRLRHLEPGLPAMDMWSIEWLYDQLDDTDVDSQTLMWWMHRHVALEQVPARRLVVEFLHTASERKSYSLVFDNGQVSVLHPARR